jgi:hypothetical protein
LGLELPAALEKPAGGNPLINNQEL